MANATVAATTVSVSKAAAAVKLIGFDSASPATDAGLLDYPGLINLIDQAPPPHRLDRRGT